MELLLSVLIVVGLIVLAVWLYIVRQGDAEVEFLVNQRTDFELVEETDEMAVLCCTVPFINKGPQDGTIMDAFTRHLLPYEQYDAVKVESRLELETAPRTDGYFEALIVPEGTGQAVNVTVIFTAANGNIREAMANMVDMPIDIVYQIVGRGLWYISKNRIIMTAEEVSRAMEQSRAAEK